MSKKAMYKVLLVDDERLVREGLKIIIKEEKLELEIIGEARNGQEALIIAKKYPVDIIITDIKMPIMNGIDLIKNSKKINPEIKFIIISGFAEFEYAKEAVTLGVTDYVLKPIKNKEFAEAIKRVSNEINEKRRINKKIYKNDKLEKENTTFKMESYLNSMMTPISIDSNTIKEITQMLPEFENCYYILAIFCFYQANTDTDLEQMSSNVISFPIKKIMQ